MKKLIITTSIILGLGLTSFAQGNMFNRDANANSGSSGYTFYGASKGGAKVDGFISPGLPTHGLSENQNAPLGSGIVLLASLGAAYLVGKKRNEE